MMAGFDDGSPIFHDGASTPSSGSRRSLLSRSVASIGRWVPVVGTKAAVLRRHVIRALGCEAGGTAVEFALVLLPILWLIFGTIQVAVINVAQDSLENVAEVVSRRIATGEAQMSNFTAAQLKASLCGSLSSLFNCANILLNVQAVAAISPSDATAPTLTFGANGQVTNTWAYDPGGPGSIVILRLMYQWPTVVIPGLDLSNLSNGMRCLVATAVIRNEIYQ